MFFWRKFPFIRLIIPFVIGIIIGNGIQVDLRWALLGFALLFLGFLSIHIRSKQYTLRWVSGVLINLLFLLVGVVYQQADKNLHLPPSFPMEEKMSWVGEVKNVQYKEDKIKSLEVRVKKIKADSLWENVNFNLLVYNKNANLNLLANDIVATSSYFRVPKSSKNPESFDYRAYLSKKGIHYICLLYTSPSPRDKRQSRMPSSA